MSQEDNPRVRRFLGDLEPYQLAERPFSTIYWPGTSANQVINPSEFTRWFMHRTVQPVITYAHLNVGQDRISSEGWDAWDDFWTRMGAYTMGVITADFESLLAHNIIDANNIVTETNVTSASQATGTLTGAANTNEKVVYASGKNSTRAASYTFDFTPNGGTAAQLVDTGATTNPTGINTILLGGVNQNGISGEINAVINPIWLQAADVMVITNTNFVAADVMEFNYVSEVYGV